MALSWDDEVANIVGDGRMKERGITVVSRNDRRRGKTDWAALDALTDEEIEASIANDPDWSDDWNWSEAVLVILPKKQANSMRTEQKRRKPARKKR